MGKTNTHRKFNNTTGSTFDRENTGELEDNVCSRDISMSLVAQPVVLGWMPHPSAKSSPRARQSASHQ